MKKITHTSARSQNILAYGIFIIEHDDFQSSTQVNLRVHWLLELFVRLFLANSDVFSGSKTTQKSRYTKVLSDDSDLYKAS